MTKTEYFAKRQTLLDEAQALVDAGRLDEFETKTQEIEVLDNQFAAACTAQANINAMRDRTTVTPLEGQAANVEGKVIEQMTDAAVTDNMYDSADYRKAFMRHVLAGAPMPTRFASADANTVTTDLGTVIPTTIMEKIVEKLESTGMILPLVTRTSYKGGLSIPTSSVKPVASWVAEGGGSDRQKKTTGSITFNYYKLRCAISVSLEVDTVTLPIFETVFISNVVEAMTKALEQAVISGSGTGQPKGILTEVPPTGQVIELTEGAAIDYQDLCDAEAALPLAYESGAVWFMTKKTFMSIMSMVDEQGQPIARVNYGVNGRPERSILGRTVILNEYMSSWAASVSANAVVAFLFNPKDYVLNTNYQMTVKRFEDNDTDDLVTKAIMLVDGKVVDKNSLVTMTIVNGG